MSTPAAKARVATPPPALQIKTKAPPNAQSASVTTTLASAAALTTTTVSSSLSNNNGAVATTMVAKTGMVSALPPSALPVASSSVGSTSPLRSSSSNQNFTSSPSRSTRLTASSFQSSRSFSFEYFPPRTEEGTQNLVRRIEQMGRLKPLYIDVTSNPKKREHSLEICAEALMYCGMNVMLHIVCAEETKAGVRNLLDAAKSKGVRNLMILRGDTGPPVSIPASDVPTQPADFKRACELIRFVRAEYGDFFCIACACYPEGSDNKNPDSYEQDLLALKEKVEAGAEFCVTQLFFDCDLYFKFVRDCRDRMGITVPIIPGIMPIQLYKVFDRTVKYLGTKVPHSIRSILDPIKDDDSAVREYGINLAVDMSKTLLEGGAPGVHFFTLNLERTVTSVIERLGELNYLPNVALRNNRDLPWSKSAHEKRASETVRPIFWSNKPKSYVARTQAWDEFPNGRWGDSSSPAYGELKGSHYYSSPYGPKSDRLAAWGSAPLSVREISQVFVNFVEGKVEYLPWSESGLALETGEIRTALVHMNTSGFLTINSQPKVNAAPSLDGKFGWGPADGYVYQKAYVEFFCCEAAVRKLLDLLAKYPSLELHAVNCKGDELKKRKAESDLPCAVTWGVFPGREILQPTIVDPQSFVAWKDEAFELWIQAWASIYPENSASQDLIHEIHGTFWLVNVVDNDFINGDIFAVFREQELLDVAKIGLDIHG